MMLVAIFFLMANAAYLGGCLTSGFSFVKPSRAARFLPRPTVVTTALAKPDRFTSDRREKLGLNDSDEEYDLDRALENNTDPLISKIVAGSLILTILALLVVGVVIPFTTDSVGMCNPILTQGRC
jgi:hypothetical protein